MIIRDGPLSPTASGLPYSTVLYQGAFVGESATGSMIQAQAAPTLKRVHFELGGKNPTIVFDDADLDLSFAFFLSLKGEKQNAKRCVLHVFC